ncbi:hypothetical protein HOLleu_26300 [Holothuria leucospilota]|uniref:CCHC-type domain-containing protein n=1 Tax=Holothuria leucospilota TaxID=206669 RepID=A0A9Q1H543_HOLLE|nr:hypothetical protein HOLleu_26300 [Holothuria leucospilota]
MIIGDSLLKYVNQEDFSNDNVTVKCLPGATVKDVKDVLQTHLDEMESISHLVIHVGTNDIAASPTPVIDDITVEFEDLVTNIQLQGDHTPVIFLSGPCPRSDKHMPQISELNSRLMMLADKLDCKFLNNLASFTYGDGEIDMSFFNSDGLHLNRKGTKKLLNKLTTIGPICLRNGESSNLNTHNHRSHRNDNFANKYRYRQPRPTRLPIQPDEQYDRKYDLVSRYEPVESYRDHRLDRGRHPIEMDQNHNSRTYQSTPTRRYADRYNGNRSLYQPHYQRYPSNRGCYNCGEFNHVVTNCRYDRPLKCRLCSRLGHKERNCLFR